MSNKDWAAIEAVLEMMKRDIAGDVADLEGAPFTPNVVAVAHGKMSGVLVGMCEVMIDLNRRLNRLEARS